MSMSRVVEYDSFVTLDSAYFSIHFMTRALADLNSVGPTVKKNSFNSRKYQTK